MLEIVPACGLGGIALKVMDSVREQCIVVAFSINSFCPIIVMIRLAMACASGQGGMVL